MEIKFLEKDQEKNICFEPPSQLFDEVLVFDKNQIVFVNWRYTKIWHEISPATYHNPADHEVSEETAEIISLYNSSGCEYILTKNEEKELIIFLKNIDYGV